MDLRARAAMGRGGWLSKLLLVLSAVFFATGFLHLRADFPNGSPWIDWSKMTDEGWYGGAAIHHFIWGHWYMADSFNPAVAMPVWPAMLGAWFAVTGVSLVAARVLTMLLYGASLAMAYAVVRRAVRELGPASGAALVGALTVLLTVVNPFCYAFDRLAVLEPVLVFWMMLGFWLAGSSAESHRRSGGRAILRWLGIGVVLGLLALTKATGVALVPAEGMACEARWPRRLAAAVTLGGGDDCRTLAGILCAVRPASFYGGLPPALQHQWLQRSPEHPAEDADGSGGARDVGEPCALSGDLECAGAFCGVAT
jgi:4-amino-4-deoxy-L-arabinose transferase-like glycosyltransferase